MLPHDQVVRRRACLFPSLAKKLLTTLGISGKRDDTWRSLTFALARPSVTECESAGMEGKRKIELFYAASVPYNGERKPRCVNYAFCMYSIISWSQKKARATFNRDRPLRTALYAVSTSEVDAF
jgi:hypothetical protein